MDPQEKVAPSRGEFCSLVPSRHVPASKEWSGEQSQFSCSSGLRRAPNVLFMIRKYAKVSL